MNSRFLSMVVLALLPIGCGSSSSSGGAVSGSGGSSLTSAGGQTAVGGTNAAGSSTTIGGTSGTDSAGASAGGTNSGGTSAGGTNSGGANSGGSGGLSAGGAGSGSGGVNAGTGGAATLADVQAIFDEHCITCHDKSRTGGLPTYPALSLVAGDSKSYLVNKAALETCGGTYVVPGAPDQSYLVRKVSDATPCEGQQMPRPFEIIKPALLTDAELATIRSWISAGAQ